MVSISIIIPTYNEEKYLPKLLNSIKKQSFKDYEIIVSDNNSKDKTIQIAKKYNCIITKGGIPSIGRNNGAKIAKGQYLFFFDADVKLPKDFLINAYSELIYKKIDLAICKIKPISNLKIDKILHELTNTFLLVGSKIYPHGPGFCIMVKKKLFGKVKGFDENKKMNEDHDFIKRASKYKKVKILDSTFINVSVRRLTKEGRLNLIKKYFQSEINLLFGKNIKIEYNFGEYKK
ncbi:MAG: glycosyltransferase [Candidatus Woesearchaeota archaeon]